MSNPTVVCVCLTCDRPEMSRRAVACFRAQSYDPARRQLIVLDTGDTSWFDNRSDSENEVHIFHTHPRAGTPCNETIGALRNKANNMAGYGEIIAHWDSDDWSHPNRLAEQVALLQASGAQCVGYNSMLFWDTRLPKGAEYATAHGDEFEGFYSEPRNEAWLYRAINPRHLLGTSLMYWRSAWEQQPFDDVPIGEDTRWLMKLGSGVVGIPSVIGGDATDPEKSCEPRMIASIHGSNSSSYRPEKDRASSRRVPEWDDYCRRIMELK